MTLPVRAAPPRNVLLARGRVPSSQVVSLCPAGRTPPAPTMAKPSRAYRRPCSATVRWPVLEVRITPTLARPVLSTATRSPAAATGQTVPFVTCPTSRNSDSGGMIGRRRNVRNEGRQGERPRGEHWSVKDLRYSRRQRSLPSHKLPTMSHLDTRVCQCLEMQAPRPVCPLFCEAYSEISCLWAIRSQGQQLST